MKVMPRNILTATFAVSLAALAMPQPAFAQEHEQPMPPRQKWTFAGPFGNFDQAQLQRGFKVYREVCAKCHGLSMISFRNLGEPGALGYSEAQIKQLASEFDVQDGPNDQGEMFQRKGRPADRFPPPFPNDNAARARYNAVPPDLSVIAKARTFERGFPWFVFDAFTQYQEQGVDYLVAFLTGFEDKAPEGVTIPAGLQYNKYFPGHAVAMPKPVEIYSGLVDYDDGTAKTPEQYAKDVAAFLMWAAEPHLVERKRLGFQVLVFLVVFAGLLYFTKKKVWSAVHDHA
jgi:ubiquinol-cytochrome c reductase cytochrome b/c1 subunit